MTARAPEFHPETSVVTRTGRDVRRCRVTFPVSVALHASGAVALAIVPLLAPDVLPDAVVARAFFVEPITAPPPPPPPPPPAARPSATPRADAPRPSPADSRFVAPVEVPAEIRAEDALDLGAPGGVPGGVEGGVPGGVIGGIVGGLPDASPPPPERAPIRVGGHVKEPTRVRHVDPAYPEVAIKARVQGIVIIEAVIDTLGRVRGARILRGVPILDEAALTAVRDWVYTPTLLDGVPTPIVMTVTVTFRLRNAPA